MKIEALPLGLFRLTPEPIRDSRGFFARCFDRELVQAAGLDTEFPQWSLSYSARRGTLRGLHWQAAPHFEVKLVQCIRGAVFDVAVDVRPDSPTRGQWHAVELSDDNRSMLYVPKGFAHGFQTLTDDVDFLYHISEPFRSDGSRGVRWDDPDLAIEWPPAAERVISDRDNDLPSFAELTTLA